MYKSIRFNERELSYFASNLRPDKEGLLEKKGAVRGQGYRQRWFRLKGNLLFYFKVDELQDWESTGDPVGVIVLERFKVEDTHSDAQPFSFALNFEGDISRMYMLRAYSEQEQRGWMNALSSASYEKLKYRCYKLQEQLNVQQGKDTFLQRQGLLEKSDLSKLPPHLVISSSSSRRLTYQRPSQRVRADWLKSSAQQANSYATFLLRLECINLPADISSSMIHVCYGSGDASNEHLDNLGTTELVESSSNPSYWHQIVLPLNSTHCSANGILLFKLVSMQTASIGSSTSSSSSRTASTSSQTEDFTRTDRTEQEICIATCQVHDVLDLSTERDSGYMNIKLNICSTDTKSPILRIYSKQVHYYPNEKTPPPSPVPSRGNPSSKHRKPLPGLVLKRTSFLPDLSKSTFWSHFAVPVGRKQESLMAVEEFSECLFNIIVPLELLKCLRKEVAVHLDEINYNIGAISESYQDSLKRYQTFLFESAGLYSSTIKELETLADTHGFKSVESSNDTSLLFLPTNLHIQKLHVLASKDKSKASAELVEGEEKKDYCYGFVTMGSPTNPVASHGLKTVLTSLPCCPSFVSQRVSSTAGLVLNELAKLASIRRNFDGFRNGLFRSSGNANPREMTSAFTGISAEVQKLLALTQSTIVLEAIGDLIRARPGCPPLSFTTSSSISTANLIAISPERRNLTLRRKVPTPRRIGCSCGKCAKCIPSPSDWIWNGSHYVQVSTGEWKLEDTTASIQELLVRLLDKVEEASKKVVEQQHEAHAASTDTTVITTFKPSYVWSESLVPIVMELHQTVEGFIKLVNSSLSFSLMKLDSCVPNLFEVKRHIDVVFSQTLTGLVTSFYVTLSEHLNDAFFMKQLETVGFLAHFECLLNSSGNELGMLEDMSIGVTELKTVKFQLAAIAGTDINFDFRILGTRENLIVQFLINRQLLSTLPNEHIRLGSSIKVIPILFAYGASDSREKSIVNFQDEINDHSLSALADYVAKYRSLAESDKTMEQRSVKIKEQFHQLKVKYEAQKSRNIEVMISAEQLCRGLKGGRITTCRTGKDRTSMAVTLEECVLLRTEHKLQDSNFLRALSVFRSTGTQLENCFKNTRCRCYLFNSAQYQMLPRILQPPRHSCRQSYNV